MRAVEGKRGSLLTVKTSIFPSLATYSLPTLAWPGASMYGQTDGRMDGQTHIITLLYSPGLGR